MSVKSRTPGAPLIELERFLPYRLNVVAEAVSRDLSQLYADRHGISIPEWRVIATLGQYERMTAKDIGAHSRMHKTKVSRAVARLTKRGCLSKSSNSDDKREAFLELQMERKRRRELKRKRWAPERNSPGRGTTPPCTPAPISSRKTR